MVVNSPIVLAITAASGILFGLKPLEYLLKNNFNVELIISGKAYFIANQEIKIHLENNRDIIKTNILKYLNLENKGQFLKVWLDNEIWASPASGSYKTHSMIISPASMATISAVASGYADNLITRAADVAIKEKRMLTIVPRETPVSSIHLENMLKLSKLGVSVVPPIVGFYSNIKTINEALDFVSGKILDSVNIENDLYERWSYE